MSCSRSCSYVCLGIIRNLCSRKSKNWQVNESLSSWRIEMQSWPSSLAFSGLFQIPYYYSHCCICYFHFLEFFFPSFTAVKEQKFYRVNLKIWLNQAASFLVNRQALWGVVENWRFLQAGEWGREVIRKRKEGISSSQHGFFWERQGFDHADRLTNVDLELSAWERLKR